MGVDGGGCLSAVSSLLFQNVLSLSYLASQVPIFSAPATLRPSPKD